jgi:2,5-furandicarboxylate decarboxylase 1
MTQDLRTALSRLDQAGQLRVIDDEVHWQYEAAAVLWRFKHGPTTMFSNVTGYDIPLVGNLLNTRDKLAYSMGWDPAEQQERILKALDNLIEPRVLPAETAIQTIQYDPSANVADYFPVPIVSEHDGGRYISAGIVTCRSPETGRRNFAICRLQVREGRIGIYMAPTHSRRVFEECREKGIPMQIAIALGLPPLWMAASQFLTPLDESFVAGGMLEEPADLVRCRTVDLEVPAAAEIVIEGTINPDELEMEGPFGEFPGTYAPPRDNPVIRTSSIASRPKPIFQMVVGGRHPEHLVTGAVAREAGLLRALRGIVPGARAVALPEGGTSRFHAVVSLHKRFEGEGKLAITTALSQQDLIKHVVVVDHDIDVTDPTEVEWAIATRFQADRDLVLVPGAKSNPVDPMSQDGTVTKMGLDATLPVQQSGQAREQVGVPAKIAALVEQKWGTDR